MFKIKHNNTAEENEKFLEFTHLATTAKTNNACVKWGARTNQCSM